ncbi:hypothetical protein, partial [Staphylococcus aureus]|uniref:hypothetical protein n=1 Tax=Staphylococcus aureus TaxID=1280 RepID=UPI0038B36802
DEFQHVSILWLHPVGRRPMDSGGFLSVCCTAMYLVMSRPIRTLARQPRRQSLDEAQKSRAAWWLASAMP